MKRLYNYLRESPGPVTIVPFPGKPALPGLNINNIRHISPENIFEDSPLTYHRLFQS